ncbi:ParB/RepB/Spo0J family partition protein [Embleya scabrispora]|uniref:ParB/RepB/Spo0J family partition protein n=1 Tax=Embleya scabrispora TaxID=159449 RepID=UPI00039BAAE9|nr:ParB/RepB/Spo0J family partition protein [Embleya scabrispora]MYS87873.1 ParB/RepB/Spo0J family partition protein [Streptomyces sp. SID5474]
MTVSKRQRSLATLLPPKTGEGSTPHPPTPATAAEALAAPPIPDPTPAAPDGAPFAIPLPHLAYNPANPRETLGDVADLADSILEKGQLQAAAVVTLDAYRTANPDLDHTFGTDVRYVVVDGNRRLLAAERAGLPSLNSVVDDTLATSAVEILESALVANIHRKAFAPLEEAKAVQELMDIHGSQDKVAKRLSKSQGWVSQRMALLGLLPELQDLLRNGELKVEDARKIGRMAPEQQVGAARTAQDHYAVMKPKAVRPERTETAPATPSTPQARTDHSRVIRLGPPADLAASLQQHLSAEDLEKLVELLLTRVAR